MAYNYMTEEGLKKLKEELNHMESVERPRVVAAIAEARDKGDLSENAEYDAAKEAQGMLEMRIAQLKDTIANARIIDDSRLNTEEVQLLNRVKIKNIANGASMEYTIVSETEADLRAGKISIATPIAKALLGHHVGDIVEVQAPAGKIKFEILEIAIWQDTIYNEKTIQTQRPQLTQPRPLSFIPHPPQKNLIFQQTSELQGP